MHELLSVTSMAGLAALLIGSIGIWTWWRKARNRRIRGREAYREATTNFSSDSSIAAAGASFSEAEGGVENGEAKNSGALRDALPEAVRPLGVVLGEEKAPVDQIETTVSVHEQPPAELSTSREHSTEHFVIDSAEVPPIENDASIDEEDVADPPASDQPAVAARELELERQDSRNQGVKSETQVSHAFESDLAEEQKDFITPHLVDGDTSKKKRPGEESSDDARTLANPDDLPELDRLPPASEPIAGSQPATSTPQDNLQDGPQTQSGPPPAISKEASPATDFTERPVEQAEMTAKGPPANDESSLNAKGEKEVSPGVQKAETEVDKSTALPATTERRTPNVSRQGSRRYEGLTRARPKSGTGSDNEPRWATDKTKVRERSLPIEVRLRFERGGSCQVSLIPSRSSDTPDETSVAGASGPLDLLAMQDDWYQDVMPEDIGRILNEGAMWNEVGGSRRWSLSGRDLYVLGARADLSGWVSQACLKLGQTHVILCSERLRGAVEQELRKAGVEHSTALDPSLGSPAGWFVIRDVIPMRPVSPSQRADILNALRPLPELEICFERGIRLEHTTWLEGYPPNIRVYGDPTHTPEVHIDGHSALCGDDGAYRVPTWDANGTHTVWCSGTSKTYSIVPFEASWKLWDAYAFPIAPGFDRHVSICGPLVGDAFGDRHDWSSTIQVPETNPVIVGATQGEELLAMRASEVRGMPRVASPSFRPVWALPTDPLRCRKQTTRVLFLGEYVEPMVERAGYSADRQRKAIDIWARRILDANRKGLAIEPDTERIRALWKSYRHAAREIWRSRR